MNSKIIANIFNAKKFKLHFNKIIYKVKVYFLVIKTIGYISSLVYICNI